MKISVVTPIYNEAKNIPILLKELATVLVGLTSDYEIVAVNDGSRDTSFEVLKALALKDTHIKVINFRVNSGQTAALSAGFDVVYCIGVLHHLKDPQKGFESVIRNTKAGGKFHCWVYAREGNGVIIYIIDPIRKIVSRLPWWFIKYFIATPLTIPFYLYAKLMGLLPRFAWLKKLPLYEYSLWISEREFLFLRHVAFDQLVTPQTMYIPKSTITKWLNSHKEINPNSVYIKMRNANSWKFGGQKVQ